MLQYNSCSQIAESFGVAHAHCDTD